MSTFSSPTDILPVTKALSATVNNLDAAVAVAFALLPTETNLTRGTTNYAVDTGAVNAYVVALPHTPSDYVDGLEVNFRPLATNTTASTINVSALGIKSIRNSSGTALHAGDLNVGIPATLRYSTATGFFHVAPNSTVSATAAATSAAAALVSENAASVSAAAASSSASGASTSASTASTQATNASNSATTATTQAGIATAKAVLTAADVVLTHADVVLTHADVVLTHADVITAANSASTAITQASNAATSASNASTSETNAAASAAKLTGTSTTSLTPSLAEKIVTTQAGKDFNAGTNVYMVSGSDPTVTMFGPVTSYTGTTLTFTPTVIGTASAKTDWTISGRAGARGATGATGVIDATSLASTTNAATSKTPIVDADELPITDSAASYALKKLTWANLKASLVNTANTWTAVQTVTNSMFKLLGSSTGATTFTSANASATNYTITVPAVTGTLALTSDIPSVSAGATIFTANFFGAL